MAMIFSVRAMTASGQKGDPVTEPHIWKNGDANWTPSPGDFDGVIDVL
jgi:hypothetical protein